MRAIIFLAAGLLALSACQQPDRSKTVAADVTRDAATNTIELIDFYGTHRCETCEAIEANAKYTVDQYFADAVKEGRLSFKTVNVDQEENYDMAERFEATGTALFINVIKDGAEQHIDLTTFAFENGMDKEAFSEELKAKIAEQLAAL